jgi:putative transposase
MAAEHIPVEVACRVLSVSTSGYYAWHSRPPSARAIRHAWLTDLIAEVHQASRGPYGALRVHAELRLGRGTTVGHKAVALLMRRAGLAGATGRPKSSGSVEADPGLVGQGGDPLGPQHRRELAQHAW